MVTLSLAAVMPLLVSALLAAPGSDAKLRKELGAEYGRYIAAYRNRDFAAMEKMISADFRWKQADGTILNRAQSISHMKRQREAVKELKILTARIERITAKGKDFVAQSTSRFEGTLAGEKGKFLAVDITGTARDTWTRTPKGWRLRGIEDVYQTGHFGGQPVLIGQKPP